MTEKNYLTKCPHCGVKFQVTLAQMKLASGAVRCGSCLEVFQANENIVKQKEEAAAPPIVNAIKDLPSDKPQKKRWSIDEEEETAEDDIEWSPPPSAEENEFDDDKPKEIEMNNTKVSMGGFELNDELGDMLDDYESNPDAYDETEDHSIQDEPEEESSGFGISDDAFSDLITEADHEEVNEDGADESWAREMLEQLEDEDKVDVDMMTADDFELEESKTHAPAPEKPKSTPKPNENVQTSSLDDDFLDDFLDTVDEEDDEEQSFDFLQGESVDITLEEPPSISLSHAAKEFDWLDFAKWSALSLAALLVAYIQYMAFNFDELARDPDRRETYQKLCATLGCELPAITQLDQIRGAQLVVRNHEKYRNALMVDAIIFNRARFPQPFPAIQLNFNHHLGKLVQSRTFTPQEYLAGELRGLKEMPVNTPIHVSLEIVDPGKSASSYVMQFYEAE